MEGVFSINEGASSTYGSNEVKSTDGNAKKPQAVQPSGHLANLRNVTPKPFHGVAMGPALARVQQQGLPRPPHIGGKTSTEDDIYGGLPSLEDLERGRWPNGGGHSHGLASAHLGETDTRAREGDQSPYSRMPAYEVIEGVPQPIRLVAPTSPQHKRGSAMGTPPSNYQAMPSPSGGEPARNNGRKGDDGDCGASDGRVRQLVDPETPYAQMPSNPSPTQFARGLRPDHSSFVHRRNPELAPDLFKEKHEKTKSVFNFKCKAVIGQKAIEYKIKIDTEVPQHTKGVVATIDFEKFLILPNKKIELMPPGFVESSLSIVQARLQERGVKRIYCRNPTSHIKESVQRTTSDWSNAETNSISFPIEHLADITGRVRRQAPQ